MGPLLLASLAQAAELRARGYYSKAAQLIRASGADSERVALELGYTFALWGKRDSALKYLRRVREALPPEVWWFYSKIEEPETLEAFLGEDTLSLSRGVIWAWATDDSARWMGYGRKLLEACPGCRWARFWAKNLVYDALGKPDSEALLYLDEIEPLLEKSPEFPVWVKFKAALLLKIGDTLSAETLLGAWFERRPGSELGLVVAGFAVRGLKVKGAERAARLAAVGGPEDTPLEGAQERRLRAACYYALLTGSQDPEVWEEVKGEPENNALGLRSLYHYTMGVLEKKRGNLDLAKEHLLRSVIYGSPRNTWPELALRELRRLGVSDPVKEARKLFGYGGPRFVDVTDRAGLFGRSEHVRVGDFNSDGWPDVAVGGKLFVNEKGKFRLFKEFEGVKGLIFLDFNRDGKVDLLGYGRRERLWKNTGKGFKEVPCPADSFPTEDAAAADLDGDGWPEVYLANYELGLGKGTPDELWRNRKGKFEKEFLPDSNPSRGIALADCDGDGDVDLYVAGYRLRPNHLWLNDGKGRLADSALAWGLAGRRRWDYWGHSIGPRWGDPDGDGDLDLIVPNLAHPRYIEFSQPTVFYERLGQGLYQETDLGLEFDECHAWAAWGDFDNDGDLDLYITSVYPNERSYLYLNKLQETGELGFEDVTYLAGARVFNGWMTRVLDFDRDGRLDILVGSSDGVRLLRNITEPVGSWLELWGLEDGRPILVAGEELHYLALPEGGFAHLGLGGESVVAVSYKGKVKKFKVLNRALKW